MSVNGSTQRPARKRAKRRSPAAARREAKKSPRSRKKSARSRTARAAAAKKRQLKKERAAQILQSQQFNKAAELFNSGKFGLAKRHLKKARDGPNASLSHRARVYLRICRTKKTQRKRPLLVTVDDYYNFGLKLFNEGKFPDAVRVLNRGIHKDRSAAHLHYLKAVAKVLAGQRIGALMPLRKAIALDPGIRVQALGDPDLQSVVHENPFAKVLAPKDP